MKPLSVEDGTGVISIWIIEESPNPGIWNVLQSRGIYKNKLRAEKAAKELQRWHRENLKPENPNFGLHYRATKYQAAGRN